MITDRCHDNKRCVRFVC